MTGFQKMVDATSEKAELFNGLPSFGLATGAVTSGALAGPLHAAVNAAAPLLNGLVSPGSDGAGLAHSGPDSVVTNCLPSPATAGAQSYYHRAPPHAGFQDTPPCDSYGSDNPFDAAALFAQQSWDLSSQLWSENRQLPDQRRDPNVRMDTPVAAALDSGGPDELCYQPISNACGIATQEDNLGRSCLNPQVLNSLTFEQQAKLRRIAMPPHLQYQSPKSADSPESHSSGNEKGPGSSPEPADPSKPSRRKRKSTADGDDEDDDDGLELQHPVKKTAHNMIEKRYRTNLNDKIAALRDSVPALRIMSKSARGEDTTEDREELHGLTPAHKLNKATVSCLQTVPGSCVRRAAAGDRLTSLSQVLSKATEYIRHLEKRNNRLLEQNSSMQARIAAFEKLFMAGAMGSDSRNLLQQNPPTPGHHPQDNPFLSSHMTSSRGPDPQEISQVSEDMKSMLMNQHVAAGRPYAVPSQPYQQNPPIIRQQQIQQQQAESPRWNPYLGKLMVGSLAGLMVLAMAENEQGIDKPEGRGLWAVPHFVFTQLLPRHVGFAGHYVALGALVHHIQILLVFLVVFSLVMSVYGSFIPHASPKAAKQKIPASSLQRLPSLASPIHVRRQAWLTAIQTVWVPRHNFFLEAAALGLKTLKYTARNIVGVQGYQLLTGLTEDQEAARVKAWTVALDAQLAGGDVEINKSRLTLTLIASGTLPVTPLRLMMQALHVRVLLWQVPMVTGPTSVFAAKLSRSLWGEARQLNCILAQLHGRKSSSDEDLPEHLAILLAQDCDKVFTPEVVQRAHNLAWNESTRLDKETHIDGMDAVVEDPAVRSPMDAIAAWHSCAVLQRVLTRTLEESAALACENVEEEVELAINVAPIGSSTQARALASRALLLQAKREANIAAAVKAVNPLPDSETHLVLDRAARSRIDSTWTAIAPGTDAQVAIRCAMAIAHLQQFSDPPAQVITLIRLVLPSLDPIAPELGLLGFTAAFQLMGELERHEIARAICAHDLEQLAGALRLWIGGPEGDRTGLAQEAKYAMVERFLAITKCAVGVETDQGYVSMSDCADDEGGGC